MALAYSLDDANAMANAHYWHGYMCYGFGRFRQGERHSRLALELAHQAGDQRLAAWIEGSLGQMLAASCQYDEAIALLNAAVSANQKRSRPGGSIAIGSAYALSCKGKRARRSGRVRSCRHMLRRSEDPDRRIHASGGQFRAQLDGVSLVWQGRWEEAERVANEGARVAESMRSLLLLAACRAAAGFARWSATGDAMGLQQLRDAVQWMEGRSAQFYISVQYAWLVEACVAEGDIDHRAAVRAHVLRRTREDERLGEAAACRALARRQRPGALSDSAGAGCGGPRLRRNCAALNAKPP